MDLTQDLRLETEKNRVNKYKKTEGKKSGWKKKLIDTWCESNIKTVVDKASELINH